jgi:hypothetical protein
MKKTFILAASLLLGAGLVMMPPVQARHHYSKKVTITDRQVELTQKIDKAYKDNELTLKESDDLKGKLQKIKESEDEMKTKNGGKLSYADENTLEKSLNSVSEKLQKKMLAKRIK